MVLAELGEKISAALKKVQRAQKIDKTLINEILKEICNALLASDVNMKFVISLRQKVDKEVTSKLAHILKLPMISPDSQCSQLELSLSCASI